jgi:hypothetical protein
MTDATKNSTFWSRRMAIKHLTPQNRALAFQIVRVSKSRKMPDDNIRPGDYDSSAPNFRRATVEGRSYYFAIAAISSSERSRMKSDLYSSLTGSLSRPCVRWRFSSAPGVALKAPSAPTEK